MNFITKLTIFIIGIAILILSFVGFRLVTNNDKDTSIVQDKDINQNKQLIEEQEKQTPEQMVYEEAIKRYSQNKNDDTIQLVAPKIFGTIEENNELKIFTTIYYSEFILDGKTIYSNSGAVVPAVMIFSKNSDSEYVFKDYIQAMDGSDFKKSIEEFCKPRDDIAKEMLNHYSDYSDLNDKMNENLTSYLKKNNLKGIKLKNQNGDIVPLT